MSNSSAPLDPVTLSALLASRVCHDLINPVGALGSGLEVLGDQDMDPAMKEAALDLIKSGGQKSVALLKFARLAYGAAGGFGAEIPMDEAGAALREIYNWCKADLDWRVDAENAPKEAVKAIMILAHAAADCVPRGGKVAVTGGGGNYAITASGPRTLLQEDLVRAADGDAEELKPKFAPAYIAGIMARSAGGDINIALDGEQVEIDIRFSAAPALAVAR